MKDILWIALSSPYVNIKHAGGQNFLHMLKEIEKTCLYNIKTLTLYYDYEEIDILNNLTHIDAILVRERDNGILDIENRINPWNRYGGYLSNTRAISLKKAIHQMKKTGYYPDIVIMQWTEMAMLTKYIQKIFNKAMIIDIEEDVSYLKRERRYIRSNNFILSKFHYIRYVHSKKIELDSINRADMIVVNNRKDRELLVRDGIKEDKIFTTSPYFRNMANMNHCRKDNNILFWGSMGRRENSESAFWFIKKVMPLL